ncbi:MAG: hypothetical protein A3F68_03115 [Acidobacteria bacterium RIFCSPLOWO2_12_FULL_54_10]|nr:MAG: hypothetical protein A3F68_03115 [Acidobacteria bacterium RIFCSPLOWO2_12_FULL_54_10]
MRNRFTTPITYFLQEGKENLNATLAIAFRAARLHGIGKIVIFTAMGEGVRLAIEKFLTQPDYENIKIVAVTFPQGKKFTDANKVPIKVEIPAKDVALFRDRGISIVSAHLPFDTIASSFKQRGVLAQDLGLVGDALQMFGGSMSLCVQAITLACDAGAVELAEHVISLTSDTAILAQATNTSRMLEELTIREILCKPAVMSIRRKESAENIISEMPVARRKRLKAPKHSGRPSLPERSSTS